MSVASASRTTDAAVRELPSFETLMRLFEEQCEVVTGDDGRDDDESGGGTGNGAHESDQNAVLPMLNQLEQSEMLPEEELADTGYGSGANIIESAQRGHGARRSSGC